MSNANFAAGSQQGKIVVRRSEGDFELFMTPAEADKAKHLVGLVLSMVGLPAIPNPVRETPFVVRVFENKTFALERTDERGSIPFRAVEGDELIKTIEMGRGICVNEMTHGKVVHAGPAPFDLLPDGEPL